MNTPTPNPHVLHGAITVEAHADSVVLDTLFEACEEWTETVCEYGTGYAWRVGARGVRIEPHYDETEGAGVLLATADFPDEETAIAAIEQLRQAAAARWN